MNRKGFAGHLHGTGTYNNGTKGRPLLRSSLYGQLSAGARYQHSKLISQSAVHLRAGNSHRPAMLRQHFHIQQPVRNAHKVHRDRKPGGLPLRLLPLAQRYDKVGRRPVENGRVHANGRQQIRKERLGHKRATFGRKHACNKGIPQGRRHYHDRLARSRRIC